MPELSKLDALLQGPSDTKVPMFDVCRTIISLSKITHQKRRDNQFSQRNEAKKEHLGWKLVVTCKRGGGNGGWTIYGEVVM